MRIPLVTVYITNYNYEDYIEQSIRSVLSQTLRDFELIIIDDGSTDNSREIIEKYRDHPKVQIIYQQNKGLNITNNVAMRAASGKYLIRLDADDYFESTALEKMSEVLERNENLGLVFPDYYYVDAKGNVTGEEQRHNFKEEVSLYDQPAHGACTMIRLEFLKNLGGYNESFTCQDGYDLWLKFITHHPITNINEPLFYYRQHGQNLTSNEDRILNTRRKIKEAFVRGRYQLPSTLAVIPVRDTYINNKNWALFKFKDSTIIEQKVEVCLAAKQIKHVIITTASDEILDFTENRFKNNALVTVLRRPDYFAAPNQTLQNTLEQAIEEGQRNVANIEAVISVALEYPLLQAEIIDDMIYSLVLFKSDSVLSVRPDNRMFYQHTGHTLRPILDQDQFTKLERDALYRATGGLVLSTIKNFKVNRKMLSGKIGHVIVNGRNAFGVYDSFDFWMFTKTLSKNIIKKPTI